MGNDQDQRLFFGVWHFIYEKTTNAISRGVRKLCTVLSLFSEGTEEFTNISNKNTMTFR